MTIIGRSAAKKVAEKKVGGGKHLKVENAVRRIFGPDSVYITVHHMIPSTKHLR